jgi:flavocytochrome c
MARRLLVLALLVCLAAIAVRAQVPAASNPEAIVVGAGLAGLSAAVEMGRAGVNVLVVDMNSVPGGHAVLAGGVAIPGPTPVQEKAGVKDSPDLAYRDWMEWTVDADPEWTRYYVDNARTLIYDWATALGVEFVRAGAAAGNSVPRFHFTKGRALHLVLPIYRTAAALPTVSFLFNARAERLIIENGVVSGVVVRHLRSGREQTLRAAHTLLATGGFESDLERVLGNWTPTLPRPSRLLIGAAVSATGSGHDMATAAGGALRQVDRHYIYIDGLPDPRDPEGSHALTAGNSAAMWVNAQGRRFTNEQGFDKAILRDLLDQDPSSYWMIFDDAGRKTFSVRGAAWVTGPATERHPILDDPRVAKRGHSIEDLARAAGLPADALATSIRRYNDLVAAGTDTDFGRFTRGGRIPPAISQPPFYAIQMFPMTRKNMGGVAIDRQARVLDRTGRPVPGLYAAGEITGSVGINGSHGLDGLFLGPAIVTGRLAGQAIAGAHPGRPAPAPRPSEPSTVALPASMNADTLKPIVSRPREGYWHFEKVHGIVLERRYTCTQCHAPQPQALLDVCTTCH